MGRHVPTLGRDDLERLIDALYASAAGETPWPRTLERLTRAFGATASVVNILAATGTSSRSFQAFDERDLPLTTYYQSELFGSDPRHPYLARVKHGAVYYDHMMYDLAEIERSEAYRENVAYQGVKYSLGSKVALPGETTALFAIMSSEAQGHASVAAIDAMQRLLPHIQRALSVGFLLEAQSLTRSALLEAVARKADGVVLLADDGTPTFMNDKASAILNAADGLAFARGRFVTARLPETARLLALIMAACDAVPRADGAGGGRMLVHRPSHKHPYLLHVSPAPRTERFLTARRIAAVLQISDLAAEREASKHALRETFGLSARESDLAVELVRLGDLEAAAKRVGMALNTARNHLHSVFLKTGVHTQADLVHLLSRVL